MIQNFIIVAKDNKGNEKMPTRSLQAKSADGSTTLYIGSGWVKKNSNGETFLSCVLEKNREFNGKAYEGYVMIKESDYNFLKNCEKRCEFLTSPTDGFENGIDMAKHPLNSATEQDKYDTELDSIGF